MRHSVLLCHCRTGLLRVPRATAAAATGQPPQSRRRITDRQRGLPPLLLLLGTRRRHCGGVRQGAEGGTQVRVAHPRSPRRRQPGLRLLPRLLTGRRIRTGCCVPCC